MMLRMTWLLLALAATINVCLCDGDTHNMEILDTVDTVQMVDIRPRPLVMTSRHEEPWSSLAIYSPQSVPA